MPHDIYFVCDMCLRHVNLYHIAGEYNEPISHFEEQNISHEQSEYIVRKGLIW